jgi:outer membrane lipoprotein-sorting protein
MSDKILECTQDSHTKTPIDRYNYDDLILEIAYEWEKKSVDSNRCSSRDTVEKDGSGTVEVWASHSEDGPGGFRIEVLESSEPKSLGAVVVSDGETLWAFSPVENKVFVGTREEAYAWFEESEFMAAEWGEFGAEHHKFEYSEDTDEAGEPVAEHDEYNHPANALEAVERLLEYVTASVSGSEEVAGETAHLIELVPIAESMPSEFVAVGGLVKLWIGQESDLLLGAAYTGGTMGEISITVQSVEVNTGLSDDVFQFEIPAGAEVIGFEDLQPESLTLGEADEKVEFDLLTPVDPPGALIDIFEVGGIVVQRFALPEGGSFTIAQGVADTLPDEFSPPTGDSQPVEVRGNIGQLMEAESGDQVLLTWTEGDLFFSVAGDLTSEGALLIAESLE